MKLIDIHCHLTHQLFQKDLPQVIKRAKKAGLKTIVCSGVNHPTNVEALKLAKEYPLLKPSLGLYPIDLLGLSPDETGLTRQTEPIDLDNELEFIKKHKEEIAAVGEYGLDFHWSRKPEEHKQQKINFQKIIDFVAKLKKPSIIHSRRAELDTFEILESSSLKPQKIILHCFEGRKHLLKKATDQGYNFTIPTIITKLQHFQTLTEIAPLQQLFTETDAPWLSPYPGKRNEPAFIIETIKKISEIKHLPQEEVAAQIWKNYQNLIK